MFKAEDQRLNCQICWIIEKTREFQKNIYLIDYAKTFDCVDHNKLWKFFQEMGIPDGLTCLLRNLYASQETTVRTGHGTTNWFQIGKGGCHPAYLTYMQSTSCKMLGCMKHKAELTLLGEISITSDMHADDTTLMAESKEELKSVLMKVKEEIEKAGLKLNIQKPKIMASGPTTSWQIDGETMETVRNFTFLGSKITADGECSHEIKRYLLLERKVMINLGSILKS